MSWTVTQLMSSPDKSVNRQIKWNFKAAIVNILILTIDQMPICNLKAVACSEELSLSCSSPQSYGAF